MFVIQYVTMEWNHHLVLGTALYVGECLLVSDSLGRGENFGCRVVYAYVLYQEWKYDLL